MSASQKANRASLRERPSGSSAAGRSSGASGRQRPATFDQAAGHRLPAAMRPAPSRFLRPPIRETAFVRAAPKSRDRPTRRLRKAPPPAADMTGRPTIRPNPTRATIRRRDPRYAPDLLANSTTRERRASAARRVPKSQPDKAFVASDRALEPPCSEGRSTNDECLKNDE